MTASVTLRAATDADADLLFRLAADLQTWEERSPLAPTPLTRAAHDARTARLGAEPPTGDSRFVSVAGRDWARWPPCRGIGRASGLQSSSSE